jgi:transposase
MTVADLLRENQRLNAALADRDAALAQREAELAEERLRRLAAEAKVKDLTRRLYGPTSEKIDAEQHLLALECLEADRQVAEAAPPEPKPAEPAEPKPPRKKRGPRRPLPENLPLERVVHDLPEEQKRDPVTGEALVKIREEITEEIDYRPSQFVRVQHVVPVYAAKDKSASPVQAQLGRVIPGSIAGPGLLSHVLVARFVDHLPYYRQEQIAARQGVILERQKLSQWTEHLALLLQTNYAGLEKRLNASGYVQCDETPVKLLDPGRPGAAREAWLWVRHAPQAKVILFTFELTRRHQVPLQFFPEDWQGVVQADGYGAYEDLAQARPGITLVACWAHARRYWTEAVDGGGHTVAEILALIAKLYRVEAEVRGRSVTEREALRGSRSRPILETLKERITAAREGALPQSGIGKAANYALNRWSELIRFAQPGFGHVEIDSNQIENGIRPSALGKRNWMFIGHPDAGWKSAVVYSIVGTCKLLGLNPESYLNWALPRLAASTNKSSGNLLPHDYLKALKEPPQPEPARR